MPNRLIKESICTSEDINQLTADEEIFFYRLMVNCDDFGRFDARIPILKSRLYPLKSDSDMKSCDIERYLKKLSEIKPNPLIFLYENDGCMYLQLVKWDKHQQIRAKRSKYPSYNDSGSTLISHDINEYQKNETEIIIQQNETPCNNLISIESDIICNQMNTYVPENPIQSNPIRESESESEKEPNKVDVFFDKCWEIYPNKKGKGQISKKAKDQAYKIGDEFVRCIERYKAETKDTNILFVKHGSTFWNSGYVDYLDKNYKELQKQAQNNPVKPKYGHNAAKQKDNFEQRQYDDSFFKKLDERM